MEASIIVAVISAFFALCSFVLAVFAYCAAKDGNKIAQGSKDSAAEANRLATESNSIAVDARQLAEEANTLSRRAEQRDTELNDVSWGFSWPQPGTCEVTNTGQDEAFGATVRLTVDGDQVQSRRSDIPSGSAVRVTSDKLMNQLANAHRELLAEKRSYERRTRGHSIADFVAAEVEPYEFPVTAHIKIEVSWATSLGQQRERVITDTETRFYHE